MVGAEILGAVVLGVVLLLVMILVLRLPAFISLLVSSIAVGLAAGMDAEAVMNTVKDGMGSTLGFVATVVGLGALFGGILEASGGARVVAQHLLKSFGEKNSGISLGLTGFLIAIPVFFDVAFIILVPVIYALQKKSGKSLLTYAIPLLSGLAITHSFMPPTPGPIAVADIIGADLGWVLLAGLIAGIPTMILSGILFGKYIGNKIMIHAPEDLTSAPIEDYKLPSFYTILSIIGLPIVLIVMSTLTNSGIVPIKSNPVQQTITLLGHPFMALILANILAWYTLGKRQGYTSKQLLEISNKSMKPAGIIILLTGAGGVFKQVLVNTKAGEILASTLTDIGLPLIVFAFLTACIIRIIQGSATVAMITASGLVAPLLVDQSLSGLQLASLVIAIASGASIFSHVNDSGFWLVKEYVGMTEKQTFRSWTMMTTILAGVGFVVSMILFVV